MPPEAERPDDKGKGFGEREPKPCPICGKPASEATRPFCSPRCRDVDLNRWLKGAYVVPASEDDTDGGK